MIGEKIIKGYAHFITKHPIISLTIIVLLISFAVFQAGNVQTKSMDKIGRAHV